MRLMRKGFTLVETLVYLALYAILVGGALAAAYSIFESQARNETAAIIEEEGVFLIGKIDWALSGADSVQSPSISGSTLSLTRSDGSTVRIRSVGSNIRIQENGAPEEVLNNTNASVTSLVFIHSFSTSDGLDPESMSASFMVQATTSDGHVLSQSFSALKYLRK